MGFLATYIMTRKEFDKGYKLLVHWCKENNIWIRIKDDLFIRQNRTLDGFYANLNGCNTYNGHTTVCDWFHFTEFKSSIGSISEDNTILSVAQPIDVSLAKFK